MLVFFLSNNSEWPWRPSRGLYYTHRSFYLYLRVLYLLHVLLIGVKKIMFSTPPWAHFQPLAQLHKLQGLNTSIEPIINFCVSLCSQGCLPLVIFQFLSDLVRSWLNSSSSRTVNPEANLRFWVVLEAVLLWWWGLRWVGFCLSEYVLGYSGGQFLFCSVAWAG